MCLSDAARSTASGSGVLYLGDDLFEVRPATQRGQIDVLPHSRLALQPRRRRQRQHLDRLVEIALPLRLRDDRTCTSSTASYT